jgi:hypothetical protein
MPRKSRWDYLPAHDDYSEESDANTNYESEWSGVGMHIIDDLEDYEEARSLVRRKRR